MVFICWMRTLRTRWYACSRVCLCTRKGQAGFVKPLKRQRLRTRAFLRVPTRCVVASPHKGTPIHYGLKPMWNRMRQPRDQTPHRARPTAVFRLNSAA